jgi:dolichol-phosphate mannosyltransferase
MATLTLIVPALNEEKNISDVIANALKTLDDHGINAEIVVINDGSTDGTRAIVEGWCKKDSRVSLINHAAPWGVGGAYWDAVDNCKGDVVTWLPGDNENDPYETIRYHGLLEHVDIVVPFVYNRHIRPFRRRMLSGLYLLIVNKTFGCNFNYTNGAIVCRKSILKELDYRATGFFFQTDILIRAAKKGYLYAEVPFRLGMRGGGSSKAISFISFLKVVKGYLRLVKDIYCSGQAGRVHCRYTGDSLTAKRKGA